MLSVGTHLPATLFLHQASQFVYCDTVIGLVVTWFVCIGTLILYFDLTIAWATTEAEVDGVVGGDGAKLVFTGLFFGPS